MAGILLAIVVMAVAEESVFPVEEVEEAKYGCSACELEKEAPAWLHGSGQKYDWVWSLLLSGRELTEAQVMNPVAAESSRSWGDQRSPGVDFGEEFDG